MSIFTPTRQPEICKTCANRGYYILPVQPVRAKDSQIRTMAFCVCENGKQLMQIFSESRLNDLYIFGRPLLDSLRECENKWHRDRNRARAILREAILGFEKLIQQLEEKINKRSENQQNDNG